MIPHPPRSTLFPYTSSSDLGFARARSAPDHSPDEYLPAFWSMFPAADILFPPAPPRLVPVGAAPPTIRFPRSEEHTSELQSRRDLVCRLLLEKKKCTSS